MLLPCHIRPNCIVTAADFLVACLCPTILRKAMRCPVVIVGLLRRKKRKMGKKWNDKGREKEQKGKCRLALTR